MIHLPPFFDKLPRIANQMQFVQSMIALLLMLKLFTLLRFITYQSPLNSAKGRFIVALRGIDYTSAFLVKVWLTMNPVKGLILGVTTIIMLNSYILLLNERVNQVDYLPCYEYDHKYAVNSYRDSVWLLMITFMTVGFGDYYPTTSAGRYIAILTAICGQLYSAIVIGLIHGQLQLTSEESGVNQQLTNLQVLKIISNNKKERSKRVVAATLIYYIMKMAGSRNKLLQKGVIHWHKTREVENIKFEIYVNVMQFKKLKHDLQIYYQSRNNDSTLNIILSIENRLALLANEVLTIYNSVKDQRMERKKNINESYFRRKSLLQNILKEEAGKSKNSLVAQKYKVQSEKELNHKVISPTLKQDQMPSPNSAVKKRLKPSVTMAPSGLSKLGARGASKKMSMVEDSMIQEEDYEYTSYSSSMESIKQNSKLIQKYSIVNEDVSISQKLKERKQKEILNQQLTLMSSQTMQSGKVSPAYKNWKQITNSDAIKQLNEDPSTKTLEQQNVSHEPYKSNFKNFYNGPFEKKSHDDQIKPFELEEELKLPLPPTQKVKHTVDQQTSPMNSFNRPLTTKIVTKPPLSKNKTLMRVRSQEERSPKRKQSTMKSTPKHRRSSQLLKSNTQVNLVRVNSLRGGNAESPTRLKAQRTQLHPTLVSIIEEDEYITEDEEELEEDDAEELEQINEDESCSLNHDTITEEDSISEAEEDQQTQTLQIKDNTMYGPNYQTNDSRNSKPLSNNDCLREKSVSSLGQAFDDYRFKQNLNQSLHLMSKIFENQRMLLHPKQVRPKLFSFNSNDELANEESPGLSALIHSSSNSGRGKIQKPHKNSDASLQISEDQFTYSQKSSHSPSKNDIVAQPSSDVNLDTKVKQQKTPMKDRQSQIHLLDPAILKNRVKEEIILSPIFPVRKKPNNAPFQLQLVSAQSSENYNDLKSIIEEPQFKAQNTQKIILTQNSLQPQIDLMELIEKYSQSPSLSLHQKQSILSFQDQINNILQFKEQVNSAEKVSRELYSHKFSNSTFDPQSFQKQPDDKDLLKEEVKQEGEEMTNLYSRIQSHEISVGKALNEARLKIQKLKAAQIHPTLQLNVINNVNNIQNNSRHGDCVTNNTWNR